MHLTVAYMTNRRCCMVEWFADSLRREIAEYGNGMQIRTVMVDFFADERQGSFGFDYHVTPKPSVWQGKHRLTTQDCFAASNARNTALCLSPGGWLLVVDDLSVLMPGFLRAAREAMEGGYIACGAYRKVLNLKVDNGTVVSFDPFPPGVDSRWNQGNDSGPVVIGGGQMFGCSNCIPVEALLQINGWDEDCDLGGAEDYICGLMLQYAGWSLRYDRRMFTIESEELHNIEKPFFRITKPGSPPSDFAILNAVRSGQKKVGACYYPEGLREVRRRVLSGLQFPIPTQPTHDWRDGQPLCEM